MSRGRMPVRSTGSVTRSAAAQRGFTLVELMIVVAIVALLAAIAYPAYTNAVRKGKRSEGRSALTDLLQQQERYLSQTGSYGFNREEIALGQTTAPFKTYSGDTPASSAYLLGAQHCGIFPPVIATPRPELSDCVEVYATPQAPFTDPAAGTLYIRSTGERGCNGTDASVCWH